MHGLDLTPLFWWMGVMAFYAIIFLCLKLPSKKDGTLGLYLVFFVPFLVTTWIFWERFNRNVTVLKVSLFLWLAALGIKLLLRFYANYRSNKNNPST